MMSGRTSRKDAKAQSKGAEVEGKEMFCGAKRFFKGDLTTDYTDEERITRMKKDDGKGGICESGGYASRKTQRRKEGRGLGGMKNDEFARRGLALGRGARWRGEY
jgi:hypothetical protein